MIITRQKLWVFSFLFFFTIFSSANADQRVFLASETDLTAMVFEAHTTYDLAADNVYEVGTSVIIFSDYVTIFGNGAIITKTGTADALRVMGSHCKIVGLEINGNGQGWCGVFVTGAHNIIEDVISYHNGGHGIGLDGQATDCRYNRVVNCTSKDNAGIGFSMNTGGNNMLSGNIAIGNTLEGFTCDGMMHSGPSYGNVFSNNICQGNKGGVGGIGIDFAIDNIFSGNVIDGNGRSGLKTQNNQGPCFGNTFTSNIIVNNKGYGIEFYEGSGGISYDNRLGKNIFRNNAAGDIFICERCYGIN